MYYGIEIDNEPRCGVCDDYHWIIWQYNDKGGRFNSGKCGHEPSKLSAMVAAYQASETLKQCVYPLKGEGCYGKRDNWIGSQP